MEKNFRNLNLIIFLLILLDSLDVFLIATTMPTVLQNLGGIGWFGWTLGAFGLASFATIPIFSALLGRWGIRKSVLLACGFFILGSIGAAIAPKMKLLVGGRVLQGLGVGGFIALPYAIISDYYPKDMRGKPLGLISLVWILSAILGPLIASWILSVATWQWVFWFNLPLTGLVLLLTFVFLREEPSHASETVGLNILGPVLFSLAGGFTLKGFTTPWPGNAVLWALAVGAAIYFLIHEKNHPNPILPKDAWDLGKPLGVAFFSMLLINAAYSGAKIYLPLVLQGVWGMNALGAGLIITIGSLAWDGSSILLAKVQQTPQSLAQQGTLTLVGTLLLILSTLWIQGPVWLVYLAWAFAGLGVGLCVSIYNRLALQISEDYPRGVAAATLRLAMTFGAAAGAAAANGIGQLGFSKGFDPKLLSQETLTGPSLHSLMLADSLSKGLGLALALVCFFIGMKYSRASSSSSFADETVEL